MLVGFLVNPIAGMGGSVGLKGTDNGLYVRALELGAKPVSPEKARRFIKKLIELGFKERIVSASGIMGCTYLYELSYNNYICIDIPPSGKHITDRSDTVSAVRKFLELGVDIIIFVGGDGTAKDVYEASEGKVPILGVPSGVKMYSGCFAASPEAAAYLLKLLTEGLAHLELTEVADANEDLIRRGVPSVRVYGYVATIKHEYLSVPSKDFAASGTPDEKYEVAEYFIEEYLKDGVLYLLGPGTTIKAVTDLLGVDKTLLGVDAMYNRRIIAKDIGENEIMNLVNRYSTSYIVVTIIGRQGYIFGRGNQQFSPRVLEAIGKDKVYVLATRSKVRGLRFLLIDTGDPELDLKFSGYWRVITGYREEKLIKVLPACCIERFLKVL